MKSGSNYRDNGYNVQFVHAQTVIFTQSTAGQVKNLSIQLKAI